MEQLKADSETITRSMDTKLEPGYILIEQWQCKLPSGKYTLAVEVRDLNSKKIGFTKKILYFRLTPSPAHRKSAIWLWLPI
jgi:hypothetical protein